MMDGTEISGVLIEEFGDTFIVIRRAGINDYNKVDPLTVKYD